jgi:hypothetical protein
VADVEDIIIHVYPNGDMKPHDTEVQLLLDECPCKPRVEQEKDEITGGWTYLIIHNAWDGRP